MAEKDIVGGIFGITPELYQQAKEQQQLAEAERMGKLTPEQFIGTQAYRGGQMLGNVASGLLGVEDTELAKIRDVQSMRSQFDVSTPEGLREFSKALSARGYTSFAMEAAKAADARAKTVEETNKLKKDVELYGREYKEVGYGNNPEMVIKALVDKEGNVIKYVGQPYSRFTAKTTIDAGNRNVLSVDEKRAESYQSVLLSAEKALPVLDRMQDLVSRGVVQGNLSQARTGFLNVLQTMGANTANASSMLSNTEAFNKEVGQLLRGIIKEYGYNPSNADVKFALDSLPELSKSPEGLNKILNSLIKAKRDEYNESNRALDWYRSRKGSFEGFRANIPLVSPETTKPKITLTKPLKDYSATELQQLIEKNTKGD